MHVLFVHPNFPAQFRCVAPRLGSEPGWTSSFVTTRADRSLPGVTAIPYRPRWGATRHNDTSTRPYLTAMGHAHGVYEALKARPAIQPDLIVAHSGFGSSVFLDATGGHR